MRSLGSISLRAKIIGMVGFIVLILGVAAYMNVMSFSHSYSETLGNNSEGQAVDLGDRIAAQFFERYGDVQAFALNPIVQNLEGQKLPSLLDKYISLYGIYDLILVLNKNGRLVGVSTKDASGKSVNVSALEALDFSKQKWFQAALHENYTEDKGKGFSGTYFEDFVDDPIMKLAFGELRFGSSFTTAVKDSNGNVVGVITNRAGKRWFENELLSMAETTLAKGQKDIGLSVANKEGHIISEITVNEESKKLEFITDPKRILTEDVEAEFLEVGKLARAGGTGAAYVTPKGESLPDLTGYRFVNNSKWISDIGWTTYSHAKADVIEANAISAKRSFFLFFSFCLLISMCLAVWFGIVISKDINGVTTTLAANSSQVSEASEKIAASASQLSESATEQAAALQETVAAVDEISAMVEKNAEAANRSKEVSQQSREAAEKGRQTAESMLSAIADIDHSNDEISRQMETSNQQLSEITKLISDIGAKTKVINEIVFQTKLLSFNASVEAARAGEYGKGFAVVAEEVGNLAQMSGNAAKEISTLLDESIRKVETIVGDTKTKVERLMNSSKDKVRQGTQTAKDCHESLDEILVNVQSVDSLVSEIAVASTEQSTGIREISKAVGQMEQVTQQNTSVAQSSAASAEQLRSQAEVLSSIVDNLVIVVSGSKKGQVKPVSRKEQKAKVVAFPKQKAVAPVANFEPVKKVANADFVPSADDAGFEE